MCEWKQIDCLEVLIASRAMKNRHCFKKAPVVAKAHTLHPIDLGGIYAKAKAHNTEQEDGQGEEPRRANHGREFSATTGAEETASHYEEASGSGVNDASFSESITKGNSPASFTSWHSHLAATQLAEGTSVLYRNRNTAFWVAVVKLLSSLRLS